MNDSNDDFNTRLAAIKGEVESHRTNAKDSIFNGSAILDLLVKFIEKAREDPAHASEHGLFLLQGLLADTSRCKKKLTAANISIQTIQELFDIDYNTDHFLAKPWSIEHENHDVPAMLEQNLKDLRTSIYSPDSEATCRIGVDIMLLQCTLLLQRKLSIEDNESDKTKPLRTPSRRPCKSPISLFPEADISANVKDKSSSMLTKVQGRADWAFGYGTKWDSLGTLLAAVEAKTRSEYSKGEAQLLAYLAILREKRLQAGKTNVATQGFWSDGIQYTFMGITNSGTVEQSPSYNIMTDKGLRTIFNFIISILETAMKSTPNATPTKPGEKRDREVHDFHDEVWDQVYVLYDKAKESLEMLEDPFKEDGDMEMV
ncbi:MAG: hypothetical protein M1840_008518 [Geoglossum simile]|nr:MAG: hypothetical protein M1840_008518 [Geoglossum simile]